MQERDRIMSEGAIKKKSFFDKFQDVAEKYLLPVGQKISAQRHLASIRDGLAMLIPLTVIGGMFILLAVPPIPATVTEPSNFFFAFLLGWKDWAAANASILMIPYNLSIGALSLYVVISISYYLSRHYNLNTLSCSIQSLFVFVCVSDAFDVATSTIDASKFGASYMFGAIIIALCVVEINRFFIKKNITIKLPDSVPPNVSAPFAALLPLIFALLVFIGLNVLVTNLTGAGLTSLIFTIFQPLLSASGSLPSLLLISFISGLFWFFGIHGDNMVSPITSPIMTAGLAANIEAYAAGVSTYALPAIFAGNVLAVFTGWIVAHVFLLLMRFACKSEQLRALVPVAIIPSLFNINEPSVFGIPEVLNIYTYIPSLICMLVGTTAYYFLAQAGILGHFFVSLPFTTPVLFQAVLGTMDLRMIPFVVALFVVYTAICYPFFKAYDKQLCDQEAAAKAAKTEAE